MYVEQSYLNTSHLTKITIFSNTIVTTYYQRSHHSNRGICTLTKCYKNSNQSAKNMATTLFYNKSIVDSRKKHLNDLYNKHNFKFQTTLAVWHTARKITFNTI